MNGALCVASRKRVLALAGLLALFAGGRARAQSPNIIHVEYRAPSGCPDQQAFVQRVQARSRRLHVGSASEAARRFSVVLESGPWRWTGRLVALDSEGNSGVREMQASSCDEVADALAFVVALTVDPDATPAPVASTPPPGTPADAVASTVPPAVVSPAVVPPAPATSPPPASRSARTAAREGPDTAAAAQAAARPRMFFAGAELAVIDGAAPAPLLAPSPYLGWHAPPVTVFAPSIRAAFAHASTSRTVTAGAAATFSWTVGRLDGCGVALPAVVRLDACVRTEVGALQASGELVANQTSSLEGWFAAGPFLRAEWAVVPGLELGADVGAILPVLRDRFYFRPNVTVFDVPPAVFEADLGLHVLFL